MRYAPNFYTAHAVLAKTTAIFPAAWKQTLPHITELFGRLPAILPQYRIVPEGEYASSPWCPDQPHFRPPAERNDRTILAAVDVTGTAHGRADARRRKLVRLPSRAPAKSSSSFLRSRSATLTH